MQLTDKKYLQEFLNADDEPNLLKAGEIINAVNLRWGSSDEGYTGRWESIPSNVAVPNSFLPTDGICIGRVTSEQDQYLVFFIYSAGGDHGIFLYYKPTRTFYKVLLNANITGGLNFSKNNLITAKIIDGKLYWIDSINEPRKINLWAAVQASNGTSPFTPLFTYSFPLDKSEITLIQRPPALAPTFEKSNSLTYLSNSIAAESFEFGFYYTFYDGEDSVLSTLSKASLLNGPSDNYNYIHITLPAGEPIPQEVKKINLVVKYGSTSKYFIIKQWQRGVDDAAITDHNAGVALTFDFYNNISGEPLDDSFAAKPYESIPLKALAIEAAKNRLFLGNLTEGYDTPLITSLAITQNTSGGTSSNNIFPIVNFKLVCYDNGGSVQNITYQFTAKFIQITGISQPGWYEVTTPFTEKTMSTGGPFTTYTPVPTTVDFTTDLTFIGSGLVDVANHFKPAGKTILQYYTDNPNSDQCTVTGVTISTPAGAPRQFKSGSQYQAGIVFYDRYLRKCGVITSESLKFKTPSRDYSLSTTLPTVNWTLDNTSAVNEIPDWACYYAPVLTKNLTMNFFLQAAAEACKYATGPSDAYVFNFDTYQVNSTAIGIDMSGILNAGLGYTFNDGDICTVYTPDNQVYSSPILGIQGQYLVIKPTNLGSLSGVKVIIEIYTAPNLQQQTPFYEVGQIYKVINPSSVDRSYSTTSGTFDGDASVSQRTFDSFTYKAEAMCPSDKNWKRWDVNEGRINLVTDLGQKSYPTMIRFSATYIDGTRTNGLSSFDALNEQILPLEMGPLQALVQTSKVQKEGTVMLAIGSVQSASIYIGETMVTNADVTSYFVKDSGVISQVNILKGDYGTLNPESIVSFKGDVLWLATLSGKFVQYSINGLDEISKGVDDRFKFSRVSKKLCEKFLKTPSSTIEAYNSRPFIFGGVDPFHKEIYWTIPRLDIVVPKGSLIDYQNPPGYVDSSDYPYDILDYKPKTLVYRHERRWMGAFNWTPEMLATIGTTVYSFKNGVLYEHGITDSYLNFYGVQYKSKLMCVANKDNVIKEFRSFTVEGSVPEWVHLRNEHPVQSSDLVNADFIKKENTYYAPIYRDRLTPNQPSYGQAQMSGDYMRARALLIMIQWNTSDIVFLRTLTLGYNISSGQL